jgi:hypothetical protein
MISLGKQCMRKNLKDKYEKANEINEIKIIENKKKEELNIFLLDDLNKQIYNVNDLKELDEFKEKYNNLLKEYNDIKTDFNFLNEQAIFYKNKSLEYENENRNSIDKIKDIQNELDKLKNPKMIVYGNKKNSLKFITPRKIEI